MPHLISSPSPLGNYLSCCFIVGLSAFSLSSVKSMYYWAEIRLMMSEEITISLP